jgi:hypothetical protein
MTTQYLDTFVGVADGTQTPALKADGRQSGAKESTTFGNKVAGLAWASGDVIYAGRLRQGEQMVTAWINTDTSLGTSTLSLGTLTNPTKYINAATFTTPLNARAGIGPKASQAVLGPNTADEDLYWTLGVAGIAGAVNLQLGIAFTSIK